MIYDNDISFLSELFVRLSQFSNIFVVLLVLWTFLEWGISKYTHVESESKCSDDEQKFKKISCADAYNSIQTPRRFFKKDAIELPSKPLIWSGEYTHTPCSMKISIRPPHVLLETQYSNSQPQLSGGPLDSKYTLHHIVFKLRPRKVRTMPDNKLFVLELYAIHFKTEFMTRVKNIENSTLDNTGNSPAVIINYVYKISREDNFALQQVISRFSMIEEHENSCYLNPFPLNWILPKFTEYYYMQQTSQPYLPYAQGVQWILSLVQQTMSKQQMITFRKILNRNYGMELNKNNKNFNKKEVFFCSEIEEKRK